jgi:hypothetical protein
MKSSETRRYNPSLWLGLKILSALNFADLGSSRIAASYWPMIARSNSAVGRSTH